METEKKVYTKPELVEHGILSEVTAGGQFGLGDALNASRANQ